ncbi:TIGR03862 family flavoprotein [Dongia rigui]|uniref:TIGR03862 family flavoprotein n=1 Tax=Dongia rigui TaxID=940149 RepID=A0ABU5E1S7_9PROT|nr:TIGR03862 family flavoprotein [Dongia rigui]MDY0873155.1 TIGR03862 family flavoprotein [Dongia rigui]
MTGRAIVIGGGPAGLMAAEALLQAGVGVDLFDAMPSVGRKFLMAGRGGLNITHSEPLERFLPRYGKAQRQATAWLEAFGPQALRDWVQALGVDTFIGTSGRVFPAEMKAAPLLRAWLHRLRQQGLRIHVRHRWIGWHGARGASFATPSGRVDIAADAIILALGGGSWPQLGSDGAWQALLQEQGIDLAPLEPANCGFDIDWSGHLRERFAGAALKNIAAVFAGERRHGEAIVTENGIEGGLIYAFSAPLREAIKGAGSATLQLDLLPHRKTADITAALAKRGSRSLSSHLKSSLGLDGVKIALLHECLGDDERGDASVIAERLKALPLNLIRPRPMAEAISSAGGVRFGALDAQLMVKSLPGLFCAGEMLDWEAPTGGYLLTASFASGLIAGKGAAAWLQQAS